VCGVGVPAPPIAYGDLDMSTVGHALLWGPAVSIQTGPLAHVLVRRLVVHS
jgi:hypothetical protein